MESADLTSDNKKTESRDPFVDPVHCQTGTGSRSQDGKSIKHELEEDINPVVQQIEDVDQIVEVKSPYVQIKTADQSDGTEQMERTENPVASAIKPFLPQEDTAAQTLHTNVDALHEGVESEEESDTETEGESEDGSEESMSMDEMQKKIAENTIFIKNEPEEDDEEAEVMDNKSSDGPEFVTIKCEPQLESEGEEADWEMKYDLSAESETVADLSSKELLPVLPKKKRSKPKSTGNGKLYPCGSCPKIYRHRSSLREHEEKFHSSTPPGENRKTYACKECGKLYRHRSSLRNHTAVHTGVNKYICLICGKGYNQKSYLTQHMLSHNEERPHKCDICGKGYMIKASLREHMLNHTGERPHVCVLCGISYQRKANLKLHMLSHAGEKPHLCKVCGKAFLQKYGLTLHMTTHTHERSHTCLECGKTFLQKKHLRAHFMTHTGERPHPCPVCSKAFGRRYALTLHMRTHTGERPHTCPICGKNFRDRRVVTRHIEIHKRAPTTAEAEATC